MSTTNRQGTAGRLTWVVALAMLATAALPAPTALALPSAGPLAEAPLAPPPVELPVEALAPETTSAKQEKEVPAPFERDLPQKSAPGLGVLAAPANDNLSAALAIGSLPYSITLSNAEATMESGEPAGACGSSTPRSSLWWTFTPAVTGTYNISTMGSISGTTSQIDTIIDVRSGTGFGSSLGCNDDFGGNFASHLTTVSLTAGTPYKIRVMTYPSSFGTIHLNVAGASAGCGAAPANDNLASAIVIAGTTFTDSRTTHCGTLEASEPAPSCSAGTKGVWYTVTPAAAGTLVVTTLDSRYDTVLDVRTGSGFGSSVACNNDIAGPVNRHSQVTLSVAAGTQYKIRVSSLSTAIGGPLSLSVTLSCAPANDNVASATNIASLPGSVTGVSGCATLEAGEPAPDCGFGVDKTLWWTFTAPGPGSVTANTFGSSFDTVLDARSGAGFGSSLACNDDASGLQSEVSFAVTGGAQYKLRVGGYGGSSGNVALAVTYACAPASPNDHRANAIAIASTPFTHATSNACATVEAGEPAPACGSGVGKTIWYTFTPSSDGTVTADTFGSAFDTVLDVRTGSGFGTSLGCNDDSGGLQSMLSFPASAGTTYAIRVGGYSGASGNVVFNVAFAAACSPAPANDHVANAVAVPTLPFLETRDTACATTEAGEPAPSCAPAGRSVWYTFTAPLTGTIIASTAGSDYDTVLDVRSGSGFGSSVACNDQFGGTSQSQAMFTVTAGAAYKVRASAYSTTTAGTLQISLEVCSGPANDAVAGAVAIAAPFTDARDTTCAGLEAGEPAPSCGSGVGRTIWYTFTPAFDGTLTVDTLTSGFDTVLDARIGPGFGSSVACNDDAVGLTSRIDLAAVAGTTYLIRLGGYNGAGGAAVLNAVFACGAPANDDVANAVAAPVAGDARSTCGATDEAGEPAATCAAGSGSIWYSVHAPRGHAIVADATGSDFATVVDIRAADGGFGTEVACAEGSATHADALAAGDYLVRVSGLDGARGEAIVTIDVVSCGAALLHDDVADALPLLADLVDTGCASDEPGEPAPSCAAGSRSVWYSVSAPRNARVAVSATGVATVVDIRSADGGFGSELACGESGAQFVDPLEPRDYLVRVSGLDGATGLVTVAIDVLDCAPPLANDDLVFATYVLGLPHLESTDTSCATTEADEPAPSCADDASGSAWWWVYVPANTVLTASASGADAVVDVRSMDGGFGDELACGDAEASYESPGAGYYLVRVTSRGGAGGPVDVSIAVAPPNDDVADARAATGAGYTDVVWTQGATTEAGEASPCGAVAGTVWYSYAPALGGLPTLTTADTFGSDFDTVLAVYVDVGGTLVNLSCNDDAAGLEQSFASFVALPGLTYYVQVGGAAGATGILNVAFG